MAAREHPATKLQRAATVRHRPEVEGLRRQLVLDAEGKLGPLSPGTIAVKLAAAKLLYKALAWAGATAVDPLTNVRAPKDNEPAWEKRKPNSAAQVQLLRAKARPVDYAIVLLSAHAGQHVN